MVGNNGFTVNWNGNAATAIDTLEEIHYHLKKFQLEITGFTFNWDGNLGSGGYAAGTRLRRPSQIYQARRTQHRLGLHVSSEFKALRKAVHNLRGRLYAAVLVDLPCIIEASKTLDMKNIIKTADVSQMLLRSRKSTIT
jgi:hypothetical protein